MGVFTDPRSNSPRGNAHSLNPPGLFARQRPKIGDLDAKWERRKNGRTKRRLSVRHFFPPCAEHRRAPLDSRPCPNREAAEALACSEPGCRADVDPPIRRRDLGKRAAGARPKTNGPGRPRREPSFSRDPDLDRQDRHAVRWGLAGERTRGRYRSATPDRGLPGPHPLAPAGSELLGELLRIEVDWRHEAGGAPTPGEYQSRFPGHARTIERLFAEAAPAPPRRLVLDGPVVGSADAILFGGPATPERLGPPVSSSTEPCKAGYDAGSGADDAVECFTLFFLPLVPLKSVHIWGKERKFDEDAGGRHPDPRLGHPGLPGPASCLVPRLPGLRPPPFRAHGPLFVGRNSLRPILLARQPPLVRQHPIGRPRAPGKLLVQQEGRPPTQDPHLARTACPWDKRSGDLAGRHRRPGGPGLKIWLGVESFAEAAERLLKSEDFRHATWAAHGEHRLRGPSSWRTAGPDRILEHPRLSEGIEKFRPTAHLWRRPSSADAATPPAAERRRPAPVADSLPASPGPGGATRSYKPEALDADPDVTLSYCVAREGGKVKPLLRARSRTTGQHLHLGDDPASRYALERELGRGAMGLVFLGRDNRLDRPRGDQGDPPRRERPASSRPGHREAVSRTGSSRRPRSGPT